MKSLESRNLVVLDIETTGVNPFKHDALAIAFVPLNGDLPEAEFFISHHELQWTPFGLSNFERFRAEWNTRAVSASLACGQIEEYLRQTFQGQEVTLVGHNVGFDIAFLRKIAFQGGRDQVAGISHRAIDTHTLLYLLSLKQNIPADVRTSDGGFKYFGIEMLPHQRHTALHDARATRSLFISLLNELLATKGGI